MVTDSPTKPISSQDGSKSESGEDLPHSQGNQLDSGAAGLAPSSSEAPALDAPLPGVTVGQISEAAVGSPLGGSIVPASKATTEVYPDASEGSAPVVPPATLDGGSKASASVGPADSPSSGLPVRYTLQ